MTSCNMQAVAIMLHVSIYTKKTGNLYANFAGLNQNGSGKRC